MLKRRTDLAVEATQLWQEQAGETTQLRGVQARDSVREGYKVTTVRILDESGAQALGKPVGTYITVELDGLLRREEDAFPRAARALAAELRGLLDLKEGDAVLVAGLGNRAITPDGIGPKAADYTLVTRHLVEQVPEQFGAFRPVSALAPPAWRAGNLFPPWWKRPARPACWRWTLWRPGACAGWGGRCSSPIPASSPARAWATTVWP